MQELRNERTERKREGPTLINPPRTERIEKKNRC